MKKYHLLCLAFSLITGISHLHAQTEKHGSFLYDSKLLENALSFFEASDLVNAKALRDFKRNYPNAEMVQWFEIQNGYQAKFNSDGINHLVTYNLKGNWQYTILYYEEKNLPSEVRSIVKRTYYDYRITGIEEVHESELPIYVVHIDNESTSKKLIVYDGEMQMLEEFKK
jgi:hypothetical protein